MRVLLATHAFLWWLAGDPELSPAAREAIADDGNIVYVSAASAWEIATKVRLGKLPGAVGLARGIMGSLADQGFQPLSVTIQHGQRAGALPGPTATRSTVC